MVQVFECLWRWWKTDGTDPHHCDQKPHTEDIVPGNENLILDEASEPSDTTQL